MRQFNGKGDEDMKLFKTSSEWVETAGWLEPLHRKNISVLKKKKKKKKKDKKEQYSELYT